MNNITYILNEKNKSPYRFDIVQSVKNWWSELDNKQFDASRTARIASCTLQLAAVLGAIYFLETDKKYLEMLPKPNEK